MTKICAEERVRDLAAAHQIQHLCVLNDLVFFEFINGQLALVYIQEVNQLSVVFNVLAGMFDFNLQRLNTLFYPNL
jgi:hypothetical protein